jgi:hypothetical protein
VINQISEQLRRVGSALLSPASLIDGFLDQIERLGAVLVPVQADGLACGRIRIESRID